MTVFAKLNYLPLCWQLDIQTDWIYHSGEDGLTKCVRLFQYFFDWLL